MSGANGSSSGVPTEVDIESLAAAAPWLESLSNYVQNTLVPAVGDMLVTEDEATVIFGKFPGAMKISAKHTTFMNGAVTSLRDIAHSLDVARRVTENIVENYKNAEHNNKLTADKIDTSFATESQGNASHATTKAGLGSATDDRAGGIQA